MKKLIVLLLVMTGIWAMASSPAPARAQSPGPDLKPTFISPTPGLSVNGWPPFTVSYPKEWVEVSQMPGNVCRIGGSRSGLLPGVRLPILSVSVQPDTLPLEDWAKILMPVVQLIGTDIKVLTDKPSRSKDGTPAREVEVEYIPAYGSTPGKATDAPKMIFYYLLTKRDLAFIWVTVNEEKARFGEDLKKHVHSLTFLPGKEAPVTVPPDVQAFLDMYGADFGSTDIKTLMTHFSDRFLHSGMNKPSYERAFRIIRDNPPGRAVATVTVFEPHGDRAYVDGFFLFQAKGGTTPVKGSMSFQQIINENSQWKWFGNQK
jgi:hypothetical protein